jgi:hypothetical protein
MQAISTIFIVTEVKNRTLGDSYRVETPGSGQQAIIATRRQFPIAKIVLEGFIVNGKNVPFEK